MKRTTCALLVVGVTLVMAGSAHSGGLETLRHFAGPDGNGPDGGSLVLDSGRIYGMTQDSGAYGGGTIFVIPEPATLGLLLIGGLAMLRRRRLS